MVEGRLAVGLIGCGHIAVNYHVPAYRSLAKRCQVVAVADPTPSRRQLAGAELGLGEDALFADARQLLDSVSLDAVDVCTPQHLRKEIILEAIERGIQVLSEKPLASIPADAAELVEAARSAGVQFGIVHNYLFWPEVQAALRSIAAGDIGRPEVAIVNFLGVPDLPGSADWQPLWRHDPAAAGGGVLMDMLHAVYVAEELLGAPFERVSAFVMARTPESQVEEIALCRYEAEDAAALVNVGWGYGPGGMHVSGRLGRVEIRYEGGGTAPFSPLEYVRLHGPNGSRSLVTAESKELAIAAVIEDFVDAVCRGRRPRATGEDGLRALEATVAAYAAGATERSVTLPLERDNPIFVRGVAGVRELPGGSRLVRRACSMKLALHTDSLGARTFPEMLDIAVQAGVEALELATGGQSSAPHVQLDTLLADEGARARLLEQLRDRGLEIGALNCSAWPLHPVHGEESRRLIERTFTLAELLEVDTVVTMSGTPGDGPGATTLTWSWYPWPPDQTALLERQWEQMLELWGSLVGEAAACGVRRLAFELHPLQLVYNVPTLERMRSELGPLVGANVDPSHLFWQQMDPPAVVRSLGTAVHHVHLKDTRRVPEELRLAGVLDSRPFADPGRRAWTFCTVGRGHDAEFWRWFVETLREAGYDGPLAIEHEDPLAGDVEGVLEAAELIRPLL